MAAAAGLGRDRRREGRSRLFKAEAARRGLGGAAVDHADRHRFLPRPILFAHLGRKADLVEGSPQFAEPDFARGLVDREREMPGPHAGRALHRRERGGAARGFDRVIGRLGDRLREQRGVLGVQARDRRGEQTLVVARDQGADQGFAGQLVDCSSQPFRTLAVPTFSITTLSSGMPRSFRNSLFSAAVAGLKLL